MNLIIEIPPISDKDCYYIQERYKCGFNTISNFNRIFKSIKGATPTEFRDSYTKNAYLI